MARVVVNNSILEVTMLQRYNAQVCMNVLHYRWTSTGPAEGDDLTDLLDALVFNGVGSVTDLLKARNAATWFYTATKYQWVSPIRYTPKLYTDATGFGENVNPALPQNVAAVLTKKAVVATRKGTGGVHFTGLCDDDVLDGFLTAARKTNMDAVAVQLSQVADTGAVLAGSKLTPIIGPQTEASTAPTWTDWISQDTVRVMRRRTVGLGI